MAALNQSDFMSIFTDGLPQFLDILPPVIREKLQASGELDHLIEVVLDYGRAAEVRFRDHFERYETMIVTDHDLEFVVRQVGEFGMDNRAGIERTLHRISCIRNRSGKVIGLTCRVGRAMEGTIDIIDDIVRSGKSILLLGRPGIGKTTKLREVARVLADEVRKRVIIVDTSNEIAGDGDVPHPAIGNARRMPVRNPLEQHAVMIEAVENHMPEVIVIDEIGTELEAGAARTIGERGVQLIATAHGQTLENLMLNPTLADLIGGIQAVTLSDDEARRRGTQKTVLERKAPPTFDVVIELVDFDRLAVHGNVMKTVDNVLRGLPARPEIRVRTEGGKVEVVQAEHVEDLDVPGFGSEYPTLARANASGQQSSGFEPPKKRGGSRTREAQRTPPQMIRIYPYGIARTRLEKAIRDRKVPAYITTDINQADAVIALRSTYQANPGKHREKKNLPTIIVKSNTLSQVISALDEVMHSTSGIHDVEAEALEEVAKAVESVTHTGKPVELKPQGARVRRLQHDFVEAKRLASESIGEDPQRRIRILPTRL